MANIPAAATCTPRGLNITTPATAALSSMTMTNDGKTLFIVKTGATTANMTPTVQKKIDDGSSAGISGSNPVEALAANSVYLFGPYSPATYNNANGEIEFAFSAVTNISVTTARVILPA
jgi:hypothetical protein